MTEETPTDGSLAGKVAVVTGATRGIGRAVAAALLRKGAAVVAAGRDAAAGGRLERDLGPGVRFLEGDVASEEDCNRLVEGAMKLRGRLDILVNNAGMISSGNVEETSAEAWDRIFDVNLRGAFLCTRATLPHMRSLGSGAVINVASIDAYWAEPELAAYCATKAGLIGLTKAIALDYGRFGIRCNCICPGYIDTEMLGRFFADAPDPKRVRDTAERMHPLGRIGRPEDVAAAAAWLASEASGFVTGQCLVVDGGLTVGGTWELPEQAEEGVRW